MGIQPVKWALRHVRYRRHFDRSVLMDLAEYAGEDGTEAFPSPKTIASNLEADPREVRRSIKNLIEDGWITKTPHSPKQLKYPANRRSTCYRLNIHKIREPKPDKAAIQTDENGVEIPPESRTRREGEGTHQGG